MTSKTQNYNVRVGKQAEKAIKGLDRSTRGCMVGHLGALAHSPFGLRFSKILNGREGERRWRVGRKWRILYEVDSEAGIINILAVRPRDHAYRN